MNTFPYPPRFIRRWVQFGPRVSAPVPRFDAQYDNAGVLSRFVDMQLASNRHIREDDIEVLVRVLVGRGTVDPMGAYARPDLVTLYDWLTEMQDIRIDFRDGAPVVTGDPGIARNWIELVDWADPDALIALAYVRRFGTDRIGNLHQWSMLPLIGDGDLRRLVARGVSDLHIHLGSLNPVPVLWQSLLLNRVMGGRDWTEINGLKTYISEIERRFDAANATELHIAITRAIALIRRGSILTDLRPQPRAFYSGTTALPRAIRDVLAPERQMLASAWLALIQGRDKSGQLQLALDRYLFGKQIFRRIMLQPVMDSNLGLSGFRPFQHGIGHRLSPGLNRSRLQVSQRHGFGVQALHSWHHLRRAELRMAPRRHWRDYAWFMDRWLEMDAHARQSRDAHVPSAGQAPVPHKDIRLAVHFKRSLGGRSDRTTRLTAQQAPDGPQAERRLRYTIDRESVALHMFRCGGSDPCQRVEDRLIRRISRVDVAGAERGSPIHPFTPALRLLRGDRAYHQLLERDQKERYRAHMPRWCELHDIGRARPSSKAPPLAMTCHAGEDFFTLIDGIWHVHDTLTGLDLRPGDGLGHALALGLDADEAGAWNREIRIRRGVLLDSMIWVYQMLERHDVPNSRKTLRILRTWLREQGRLVYRCATELPELMAKLHRRHLPIYSFADDDFEGTDLTADQKWQNLRDRTSERLADLMCFWDIDRESVAAARSQFLPLPDFHYDLRPIVPHLQQIVLEEIIARGVVVETNPSSNLRLVGQGGNSADYRSWQDSADDTALPIIRMTRRSEGRLRVTVATDNPGVYDTRVENEYAILFDELTKGKKGLGRGRALETLDAYRRTGLEDVSWPHDL